MTVAARPERVVVIGATGFIGRPLARALVAAGLDVHGVCRAGDSEEIPLHHIDVHDRHGVTELMQRLAPTHLVHLAWTTGHGAFWHDPGNLDWVAGTLHLLRAFHGAGGRRALMAGSCAEYDWSVPGPYTEKMAGPRPHTLYGTSKLATGLAALSYGEATDLEVTWARLFHLYGPDEDPRRLVPQLLEAAAGGSRLELRNPANVIDLMHVDDAAGALARVASSDLTGPVNVATGRPCTLGELGALVGEITGVGPTGTPREDDTRDGAGQVVYADTTLLESRVGHGGRRRLEDGLAQRWDQVRSRDKETV